MTGPVPCVPWWEVRMFVDVDRFPFLAEFQDAWPGIRSECLALDDESFEPWVQREMYGSGWSVYGLVAFGARIDAALANCPRTAAALDRIPGLTTAGFSRMVAGTHILDDLPPEVAAAVQRRTRRAD